MKKYLVIYKVDYEGGWVVCVTAKNEKQAEEKAKEYFIKTEYVVPYADDISVHEYVNSLTIMM